MADDRRRARDLGLLDALDEFRREALDIEVWRLVRAGRDPALGSPSLSRWCNGTFDVLYTSLEWDGAVAEIHTLLSLQPVFPSRDRWFAHKLKVVAAQTLRLADLQTLARLGVDAARYREREYDRTQEIADAAFFLGFDGLIAPSARWTCLNFILFTDRITPDQIQVVESSDAPVSWEDWRKRTRPKSQLIILEKRFATESTNALGVRGLRSPSGGRGGKSESYAGQWFADDESVSISTI